MGSIHMHKLASLFTLHYTQTLSLIALLLSPLSQSLLRCDTSCMAGEAATGALVSHAVNALAAKAVLAGQCHVLAPTLLALGALDALLATLTEPLMLADRTATALLAQAAFPVMLAEPTPTPALLAQADLLLVLALAKVPVPPHLNAQTRGIRWWDCATRKYQFVVFLSQVEGAPLALYQADAI